MGPKGEKKMKKLTIGVFVIIMMASFAYADDVRQISLMTNDIIYDPFSMKIYASVPSSAGSVGNSIISIDPYTGVVGSPVFVGSEPRKLAISDNGQYLYVSLDGATAVRRFDIRTHTAGLQFPVGNDRYDGPYFVNDMEVLPGNPETVAISRRNSCCSPSAPSSGSVAIYDNGIQRLTTPQYYSLIDVIEFSSSASRLYGYNNETTGYDFTRMAVIESGVFVVDAISDLITGFRVDIKFDNGLIYATTGRVIDPEARVLVGTFTGFPTSGALVKPDSKVGRVFFLSGNTLFGYDLDTFLPVGSLVIQGGSGTASSLIRWGSRGLSFRTSDKVFLVRTALIPASQVDFDGDGKADVAIFRANTATWYIVPSGGGTPYGGIWGEVGDKPVPGDYDGDGRTDLAAYHPTDGGWWIVPSGGGATYSVGWGGAGFTPVPGDYDGDGKTDIAIYDTTSGAWWIIPSSGIGPQGQMGAYGVGWGGSAFKAVPGDYDRDGKTDIAIYSTANGGWWIIPSSGTGPQGQVGAYGVGWGGPGYTPVPGDYDGDGKTDVAIYQNSNGSWWITYSSDGSMHEVDWGGDASDLPLTTNPD